MKKKIIIGAIIAAALALVVILYLTTLKVGESLDGFSKDVETSEGLDDEWGINISTEKNNGSLNNTEGQAWPNVIPSDIPVLAGVTIDGYWPMSSGENEYTLNFEVTEQNKQIVTDYAKTLERLGYTKGSEDENKFGINYVYSNNKYSIFINMVYGSLSKLTVTMK